MVLLSLGAGVQSSTMALMAACGELSPTPHAAIFADTQGEPREVYEWLSWLERQLPFPVVRVTSGDLAKLSVIPKVTRDGQRSYLKHSVPAFIVNPDGSKGMARRQCTRDFKIDPIRRAVKKLGASAKAPCEMWIGISTDEATRMKPSQHAGQIHRWPLIEKEMSRTDCLEWMERHNFPLPPKSACTFCPYHSDELWTGMSSSDQQFAIDYENKLQAAYSESTALKGVPFLHSSRIPLSQVLENLKSGKQQPAKDDLFDEECEGMCGV